MIEGHRTATCCLRLVIPDARQVPIRGPRNDPNLAYIAATVHALCLRDEWRVPDWVHQFVSETLFTGHFTESEWEDYLERVPSAADDLDPVGKKHNVIRMRIP